MKKIQVRKKASQDSDICGKMLKYSACEILDKEGDWYKLGDNVYLYTHNSTSAKMRILNKLFDEYGKDKSELIFNLKPDE